MGKNKPREMNKNLIFEHFEKTEDTKDTKSKSFPSGNFPHRKLKGKKSQFLILGVPGRYSMSQKSYSLKQFFQNSKTVLSSKLQAF